MSDARLKIDEAKTALIAHAKASMREHLRSKSWVEKVQSVERMNRERTIARAAMKKELHAEAVNKAK